MKTSQFYALLGTLYVIMAQNTHTTWIFVVTMLWAFLVLGMGVICHFEKD